MQSNKKLMQVYDKCLTQVIKQLENICSLMTRFIQVTKPIFFLGKKISLLHNYFGVIMYSLSDS